MARLHPVEVESHCLSHKETETLCLVYPVPDYWWSQPPEHAYSTAHGQMLVDEEDWSFRGINGCELLNDFVKLAPKDWDIELTENDLAAAAPRVQRFVERWGPLCLCATPRHYTGLWFANCYWELLQDLGHPIASPPCW